MSSMSTAGSSFDSALRFSLEKLSRPDVVLKSEQRSAIEAVYLGRDVFVCLPTGFGKSLCYQVPRGPQQEKSRTLDLEIHLKSI